MSISRHRDVPAAARHSARNNDAEECRLFVHKWEKMLAAGNDFLSQPTDDGLAVERVADERVEGISNDLLRNGNLSYMDNPSESPIDEPASHWFFPQTTHPCDRLERYIAAMTRKLDSVRKCSNCGTHACWRVAPRIDLPRLLDPENLRAMRDYARRNTPGLLRFVRMLGESCLTERCSCRLCAPEPEYVGDEKAEYAGDASRIEARLGSRPSVASSRTMDLLYHAEERVRAWFTGQLGIATCWLLRNGSIDAVRHGAEICELFETLMNAGNVSLAVPFVFYVPRKLVATQVERFVDRHFSANRKCPNYDACWLRFALDAPSDSTATIQALRMLTLARDVPQSGCDGCDCLEYDLGTAISRDMKGIQRSFEDALGVRRQRQLTHTFPLRYENATVSSLAQTALRKCFYAYGAIGVPDVYPACFRTELNEVGKRLLDRCSNILYENYLLAEIFEIASFDECYDGINSGGGRCIPCAMSKPRYRRKIRHSPRRQRFRSLNIS